MREGEQFAWHGFAERVLVLVLVLVLERVGETILMVYKKAPIFFKYREAELPLKILYSIPGKVALTLSALPDM